MIHQVGEVREDGTRSAKRPNVILIPGIMGSELAFSAQGKPAKLLWVDLVRLLSETKLEELRLAANGKSQDKNGLIASVPGILSYYFDAIEQFLLPNYNVRRFAYDWRRDIRDIAQQLHFFIQSEIGDQPVHLIAHSMGGLVARAFIAQRLAADVSEDKVLRGGRLLMLGTPNSGSYEGFKILSGAQDAVQLLALGLQTVNFFTEDFDEYVGKVRSVVHSFPAVYQLLPPAELLPQDFHVNFYDRNGYVRVGRTLSNDHFQAALETQKLLENAVFPDMMRIVAGCDHSEPTAVALENGKRIGPETKFVESYAGDGMVPHALTTLKDVPQYYVVGGHGDLVEDQGIMNAIDTLLSGTPNQVQLSTTPIPPPASDSSLLETAAPAPFAGAESCRLPHDRTRSAQQLFQEAIPSWTSSLLGKQEEPEAEARLMDLIVSGWLGNA